MLLPVGLEQKLREMSKQIQNNPQARDKVEIAFTEWLFWARLSDVLRYDNMGGALCTAGFLNMLLRVADIVPVADMTGIIEFGGIWKKRCRAFGAPSYWVFRMYSNADASQPVETRTQVEKYNVEQGSVRLPSIAGVPYLDVVAALNDTKDKLTLFGVNRHLTQDITAHISITGFDSTQVGRLQTLSSVIIYDRNDEGHPATVVPQESRVRTTGYEIGALFPA